LLARNWIFHLIPCECFVGIWILPNPGAGNVSGFFPKILERYRTYRLEKPAKRILHQDVGEIGGLRSLLVRTISKLEEG
jgi:hypothetical protein